MIEKTDYIDLAAALITVGEGGHKLSKCLEQRSAERKIQKEKAPQSKAQETQITDSGAAGKGGVQSPLPCGHSITWQMVKTILFFSVVMLVLIVRRADTIQWLDWLLGVGVGVMLSAWVAYWRLRHD
ncbi:hypothetical protein [Selenomonas sp. F0473]|uniref:hypothetical protein n=1 Tax=Selenomonas sp. F0473 TaxID=999423 RepID=UPI00029E2B50|nr:hypothetical protein [Selenomonas sp. F0473]EKU72017.1 hypothetical protein HMPREF9161_00702 [Selenomonas sp. F0473]